MKKKTIAVLIAAAVMLQPTTIYANPSSGTKPTPSQSANRDKNISKDYHMTDFKSTSGTGTGTVAGGSVPAVSVVSGSSTGTGASGTGAGSTTGTGSSSSVTLEFGAGSEAVSAGLSQAVVEKINTINSGTEPLYRTIGTSDLVGYSALIPVTTVVAADAAAVDPQTGNVPLTINVPNLIEGLNEVQILYFNKTTGQWEKAALGTVDYATKQVSLNIANGTPFTIIYKSKS